MKYFLRSILTISVIGFVYFILQKEMFYQTDCEITTPNIIGLQINEADTFLTERSIKLSIVDTTEDLNLPEYIVLEQFPAPYSTYNDTIFVVINKKN